MPHTKWWVKVPKSAEPVEVEAPDPKTQPKPVDTPKASRAKAEVDVKDD
jgi:hypothetical protein